MIEPLPPALAALIAAERTAPAASTAARVAVKAKLAASIAATPIGAAATGFGVGKVLAIVALTVGAGTATVIGVKSHATTPPAAPAHAVAAPAISTPVPVASAPVLTEPVTPPASPPVRARRAPAPVETQATLLKRAWSSLSAGDVDRALELVELDAKSHPDGALTEERSALEVVALARLGRTAEARQAAASFEARYPRSIHRDLIAKAIGGLP